MKSYKVTRVYTLEAESKADAMAKVAADALGEYLSFISVYETQEKRGGFGKALKDQVFGA